MKYFSFFVIVILFLMSGPVAYSQVSVSTSYTQNFDGLGTVTTAWADGTGASPTLQGWCLNLRGSAPTTNGLVADAGTGSSGTTGYNEGKAGTNLVTERALAILSSSTTTAVHAMGVRLKNTSGGTVSSIFVSFHGETWKAWLNNGPAVAKLTFTYQTSASAFTSLITGTYTANTALDYTGVSNATAIATDGNALAYSTYVSGTISSLALANNSEIMLRWVKLGTSSSILGVDDFIASWEPTAQPSSLTFPTVATTSLGLSYSAGATGTSGVEGYLILQKAGSAPTGTPVKGTTYNVGDALGDATVAYVGSSTSPTAFTSLTSSTTYYYAIYAYNASGKGINYLTTSPLTGSQMTASSGTPPTIQPAFSTCTNIGTVALTANWTVGNGADRVVYMNSSNSFVAPTDGSTPTASTAWANSGQQCIYNGSGTSVSITGLSAGTTYYFQAYEYNTGASTYFNVTSPANTSQATTIVPVTQSSAVGFSPVGTTSFTINWTPGTGAGRIVRLNSTNSFTSPSDGTSYTGNAAYTSGERTVYSGTGSSVAVTGLSQGTTYYVEIFEYNGTGTGITYNPTSPATGNQTTNVNPPSTQPTFTAVTNIGTASISANWSAGNGAGRVVYICDANTFVDPSTGVSPSANTVYAGTGQQCVYNGTGTNTVSITGLTAGTAYYLQAYEYNGSGATITFLTTTPANASTATVIVPVTQSSAINFTTVTTTTMTINWTSGSGSNRIVRMNTIDSFTDPVNGTAYTGTPAYTSGEITVYSGTAATVSVTGLHPTTTYYVRIYEFNGTGTGIAYNTLAPATGNQATPEGSSTVDYFRSAATGNWSAIATWEGSHDSTSWFAATITPTSAAKCIDVLSGHTVTVDVAENASNLIINSGGSVAIATGIALTVNHSSYDLRVSGVLSNAGTLTYGTSATGTILDGGKYQHVVATTIPIFTWAQSISGSAGSTCELTGTAAPTTGLTQNFWNFTVNQTYSAANNLSSALTTVNGTFLVSNTGGYELRLSSRSQAAPILNFGAVTVTGSTSRVSCQGGGTGTSTNSILNIASDLQVLNGASFYVYGGGGTANSNNVANVNLSGNLTIANARFGDSTTTNKGNFNFVKSGLQTVSISAGSDFALPGLVTYTVNNGSIVNLGSSVIGGTNSVFTVASGATLKTGHAQGLSTTVATGAIQVTGTKTFNAGANYEYNGSSAQVTGNALPATVNNLTINNTAGVTLTANGIISSALTLSAGLLHIGNFNLTLAAAAVVSGTPSASNMVITDGTGQLRKTFSADGSFTFPVGDNTATAEYSPMSVTLAGGAYSSAYVSAIVVNAKQGSSTSSTDYINRYWTLASSGITGATYDVTGTYVSADVVGTESNMITAQYASAAWTNLAAVNATLHTIGATGLLSLGDFTAITKPISSGTVTITLIPEGYYRSDVDPLPVTDTFTATLASATGPDYADVETVNIVIDSVTFTGTATFPTAATGSYYLYVKGLSLMATWSAAPISYVKGSNVDYDFTTGVDKAYAIPGFPFDPMILQGAKWTIYSGDVDQDELIGNVDLTMIDNDAFITLEVHGATDLDGDALVGNVDLTICDNHAFWVVESQTPRKVGGMASKYLHKPVLVRKSTVQK